MNEKKKTPFDPTVEMTNKMEKVESSKTIAHKDLEGYLKSRVHDNKVTIWISNTLGCISHFFQYGENLEQTEPMDDQRYHGFSKYRIELPQSKIKVFVQCISSSHYHVIEVTDRFVKKEVRVIQ